jgi:NadR type nicotinamide-nucleotide adenylyltransferase
MKKIVIIGPESTGKTTMAQHLAAYFQSPIVEEFARTYIDHLDRPYNQQDLLEIARGQIKNEDRFRDSRYLFCDTDLRVIKIWSKYKYGNVHPWILEQIKTRAYNAYLLMGIDLPWNPDPQREHPKNRQELFDLYRAELKLAEVPFTIISGEKKERSKKAIDFIARLS